MSSRTFLLLAISLSVLALGGAAALGFGPAGTFTPFAPFAEREPVARFALDPASAPDGLPAILGPDDPSRPLVVIDPGHGGRDLGAVWRGPDGTRAFEKDIVLAIAELVKDDLLAAGGVRIALTRQDDTIVPLRDRPEIARALGANLFLSIHADSAGTRSDVTGASIYTLSDEASSEAAARFAARENAADRMNGVSVDGQSETVSAILVELSQQRTQEEAAAFASLIEREGASRIAFHPQTRRSADLAVLRAPDMPGVLFESGFVTNAEDRARLTTQSGRAEFAGVLARAIRVYFARQAAPE